MIFQYGKRYEYPFPLLYDRRVWPLDGCYFPDYAQLLANLPEDKFYVPNANQGHLGNGRSSLSLVDRRIDPLPTEQRDFWRKVRDRLHDHALSEHIASRLGVRKRPLHPFATLVRDRNHKIDVHPDWDMKVITVQFYLPHDESMRDTGTVIYDEHKKFVRRLPFLPNTAYAFARSDTSYHGLDQTDGRERNSLMLTYTREPWDEY